MDHVASFMWISYDVIMRCRHETFIDFAINLHFNFKGIFNKNWSKVKDFQKAKEFIISLLTINYSSRVAGRADYIKLILGVGGEELRSELDNEERSVVSMLRLSAEAGHWK